MQDAFDVKDYGAQCDGSTDDTGAINSAVAAAFAANKRLYACGRIRVDGNLNLRRVSLDFEAAEIEVGGSAIVMIGGHAGTSENKSQSLGRVFRAADGNALIPTLRMMGAKNQQISIRYCNYLQLWADATNPSDSSIAYCAFHLGHIEKIELNTAPVISQSAIQWINENHFSLQRCSYLIFDGSYPHNHNKIAGGSFEGTFSILFNVGTDNYLLGTRFEGGKGLVSLAAETQRNIIVNTWDSSTANFDKVGVNVVDNGFDNVVMDDFANFRHAEVIACTNTNDIVLDTMLYPSAGRRCDLLRIAHAQSARVLVESELIDIVEGDIFRLSSFGPTGALNDETARYRPRIEFYDSNQRLITPSLNFISTTGGVFSVVVNDGLQAGTNVSSAVAIVARAAVDAGAVFVRVYWYSNSPSTDSISNATDLRIIRYTKNSNPYRGVAGRRPLGKKQLVLTAPPSQGFAPLGLVAVKNDGTESYTCVLSVRTRLTVAAALNTTSLVVETVSGVQPGDIVGVNLNSRSTLWGVVISVVGTTVEISTALSGAASLGAGVVFNRWIIRSLAAAQPDSVATDVAGLREDLNAILVKLRAAGLMVG
ncbi:hypothetical protein EGT29_15135 [Pigmentiphaga sp. H8]|uniref:hypothetical protein n=1 Tax=Pigmentiphaga sp. H8 TaxID=2488560 RepID=UPI000F59F262|nr:hypothetical protein [Pigmentiphaga sp. H8]AZG09088.1 hypothetical protein EGT29_15135 [Pigmentiphaga sp. H8]